MTFIIEITFIKSSDKFCINILFSVIHGCLFSTCIFRFSELNYVRFLIYYYYCNIDIFLCIKFEVSYWWVKNDLKYFTCGFDWWFWLWKLMKWFNVSEGLIYYAKLCYTRRFEVNSLEEKGEFKKTLSK